MKGFSIAIDGPVAAGKGTIAPTVAQKLNGVYLDTGAMYRAVSIYFLRNNVDITNVDQVEEALSKIDIDITSNRFFLNGEDITEELRTKEVDFLVSKVAGILKIREALIFQQKKIAEKTLSQGIPFIAEGRDIATNVIPNANLKIFLTADVKVRAERRLKQKEGKDEGFDYKKILEDVIKRDNQDIEVNKTLVTNPEEHGYVLLDNTDMSEEETVDFILERASKLQ